MTRAQRLMTNVNLRRIIRKATGAPVKRAIAAKRENLYKLYGGSVKSKQVH